MKFSFNLFTLAFFLEKKKNPEQQPNKLNTILPPAKKNPQKPNKQNAQQTPQNQTKVNPLSQSNRYGKGKSKISRRFLHI